MEPVTSLILAVGGNFLSSGLKSGYRSLSDDDFQDYFDAAAARTAEEFDLDSDASDAFDSLFHADLPTEDLAAFKEKLDRTAHRDFAARLQTATDTTLDDPEQVVTAFFRNIVRIKAV